MRKLLALILLLPSFVWAATCGPGTSLAWDYTQPLPTNVDGFKLYANAVEVWTGTDLTATPDLGTTEETKTFYVTAYNSAQESAQSNSVSCEFVTTGPALPLNLRFAP